MAGIAVGKFISARSDALQADDLASLQRLFPGHTDLPAPNDYCIALSDVKAALRRVRGTVHRTPVLTCAELDKRLAIRAFSKISEWSCP